MALQTDKQHQQDIGTFDNLIQKKAQILNHVQDWVNQGTSFYAALDNAGEKAEVLALRNAFIAELRAILGV
jgi:hypothetical protein